MNTGWKHGKTKKSRKLEGMFLCLCHIYGDFSDFWIQKQIQLRMMMMNLMMWEGGILYNSSLALVLSPIIREGDQSLGLAWVYVSMLEFLLEKWFLHIFWVLLGHISYLIFSLFNIKVRNNRCARGEKMSANITSIIFFFIKWYTKLL